MEKHIEHIFIGHGNDLFILFLFPLAGLFMESNVSLKATLYILFISLVLLIPLFTEYNYTIPYLLQLSGLLAMSSAYSLISRLVKNRPFKIVSAWLLSLALFIFFGFGAMIDAMAGNETVEYKWKDKGYRIEYMKTEGPGRAAFSYKLAKFYSPLFVKYLERTRVSDTTKGCFIEFRKAGVEFNRCKGKITRPK